MQVVASQMDVASSDEFLDRLIIADDHAKPVSSTIAYTRSSAINATDAAAEATHISSVNRLYVTTSLNDIDRISTLPFSSSVNQSETAQQLSVRPSLACLVLTCCVMSATRRVCAPPRGSPGGGTPSGDRSSGPSCLTTRRPPPSRA